MNYKMLYLMLAVVGCIVPYVFALQFVSEGGLSAAAYLDAVTANGLAAGYTSDSFIAALAFWAFTFEMHRREDGPMPWLFVLLTLFAGIGFALPLYLFVRHVTRDTQAT